MVDAYAQLTAEGYLSVRQGARPRVAAPRAASPATHGLRAAPREPRFDFRPSMPDVTPFPRAVWARCLRNRRETITDADLATATRAASWRSARHSPTTSAACVASSPRPRTS